MSAAKQRAPRTGPAALDASAEARKRATVILETMLGARSTEEAAEALGVAPARYYQLEAYALQGLLEALEPRPRGRQVSAESEAARLQGEVTRLEREVKRQQALYRTAQRALGVPKAPEREPSRKKKGAKKTKRRRRAARGEKIVAALVKQIEGGETCEVREDV